MRRRVPPLFLATLAAFSLITVAAPVAQASIHFAQDEDTTEKGSGQSDEGAETGPNEGETAKGESTEEEGPPWTYQMARIGVVLLLLIAAQIGFMYYKMIVVRQRGGA